MRSSQVTLYTGLRLHVLQWGEDHQRTVLLLHGFRDFAGGWLPLIETGLLSSFHLIAPDFRGHGESDRVGAGGYYHFADHLADLHALLQTLPAKPVSLVGHSMGGMVASFYAGAFPERVEKLALLEGTGPPEGPQSGPERLRRWVEAWQTVRSQLQKSYASLEDAAARIVYHDPLCQPSIALELARRGTALGSDGRFYFRHDPLHSTTGPYPFQVEVAQRFWRAITCPVLLIEGERSEFRYAEAERARRNGSFAQARTVVLAGAGHMMQRHRPAELAQLLVEFLERPTT